MTRCNHRCGTNADAAAKEPKTLGLLFFAFHLFTIRTFSFCLVSVCACGPFSDGHIMRLWRVPNHATQNRPNQNTSTGRYVDNTQPNGRS